MKNAVRTFVVVFSLIVLGSFAIIPPNSHSQAGGAGAPASSDPCSSCMGPQTNPCDACGPGTVCTQEGSQWICKKRTGSGSGSGSGQQNQGQGGPP